MIKQVRISDELITYIIDLVEATRKHPHVRLGGSPRAMISLLLTSKANALIEGRDYIIPDDIKFVAKPVLRHRIILKPEAEFEGITPDQVIDNVLQKTPVPTPGV